MAIFNEKVIENLLNLQKIRNMQLRRYDAELERICRMPEEERIEQLDKMRVLLRLKELYERLDIKIIEGETIFFNGQIVLSDKQLIEINNLADECFKEEKVYTKLIENEKFILTNDIKVQLEEYIEIREYMLEDYIKHCINATIPQLYPQSVVLMASEEYIDLIKRFSKLKITIENEKVYKGEKLIAKKVDYFNLLRQTNQINKIATSLLEKIL